MGRRGTAMTAMVLVLGAAAAGCRSTPGGSEALREHRGDYASVIQRTNGEQLLLNLVRLRYRDVPFFLEVASVTTTYEYGSSASGRVTMPMDAPNTTGADLSLRYTEKPTVSYVPLQGETFVRQMLSPVSTDTVLLLYHSGWSVERLAMLLWNGIGPLANAPSATGPTPSVAPDNGEFREAAGLLRSLQARGGITLGAGPDALVLRVAKEFRGGPEVARLTALLGKPKDGTWLLGPGASTDRSTDGTIDVSPRSVMGALYFLSQAVEVPAAHETEGRVTVTTDADGGTFHWSTVNGDHFRVHSGSSRPSAASVAVEYRDHWFWIADDDLDSKSTFSLLSQVLALQSGGGGTAAPVLTLGVN